MEVQDEGKVFHYTWFLMLISLVARRITEENHLP